MPAHDIHPTTFADNALRDAFRAYFSEMGITVRDWEGLFREIDASDSRALICRDGQGGVAAFLLYAHKSMTTGFYTAPVGTIDEFWVSPTCRRNGVGTALLAAAEAQLAREGCGYVLLTTDTAPDFFAARGYVHQPAIAAKNGDPVFVKPLAFAP